MKVLITGASGFVGRWLHRELVSAGHVVVAAPPSAQLSVIDFAAMRQVIDAAQPDAVAHLAAVAFGPDAAADPERALQVNVRGTISLTQAIADTHRRIPLLLASSSEVYGRPSEDELPLAESAPLRPSSVYAVSKAAQEAVALSAAFRLGLEVVVARSFNHTGPGQRPVFAVPAFIQRALALESGKASAIRAGNVEVARDIGDVRDVVRAYRLLLEDLANRRTPSTPEIFNVATGAATEIRSIIENICEIVGVPPKIVIDLKLVRRDDPPLIVGNFYALRKATGWQPQISLKQTLIEMVAAARRES